MFVDHAVIRVKAGDGGNGCVSFRREKHVPRGGPDGGDGGDGGSVIAVADPNVHTLLDFRNRPHWHAKNAGDGLGGNCHGPDSDDLVLHLPAGTLIYDEETEELIADLGEGEQVVVARGGKGGLGNDRFKSSTNQTPRESTPGEPGEAKTLRLELKLIADVGFVGLPNAGKSTLLRALTRARPKVADYPFTTLTPQLGIAEIDPDRRLVLADIPGLIEGAAQGAGLGHDFLRHIERTKLLVHVLDTDPPVAVDPAEAYRTIRGELGGYSAELARKPEIIALNKIDLIGGEQDAQVAVQMLRDSLGLGPEVEVFPISAVTGLGVRELLEACWRRLNQPTGAGRF